MKKVLIGLVLFLLFSLIACQSIPLPESPVEEKDDSVIQTLPTPSEPPQIEEVKEEVLQPEPVPVVENQKFLVHFPWPSGKAWDLTTNFHDENCLDFVNFKDSKAEVVAAADGTVFLSEFSYPDSFNTYSAVETNNPEDMGNFVIIKHNSDTYTLYFHLVHENTPPVNPGDSVKAGTRIGYQGNTGWSHGKHLHFCVVDVSIFPPGFITKPLDSWGFIELDGSNKLVLNQQYTS